MNIKHNIAAITLSLILSVFSWTSLVAEDSKEKDIPLKDQINTFFGKNIVGPMWSYFLGFSVKDEHVLVYKAGTPLFRKDGSPVMGVAKPQMKKDENGTLVPVLDEQGNITYNDPLQIVSRPRPVVLNNKQIDTTKTFSIVLINGAPHKISEGQHLVLSPEDVANNILSFEKDADGKNIAGAAVQYKGKALNDANGNPVLSEHVSFLHSIDNSVTLNSNGKALLTVGGNIVVDNDGNEIALDATVSKTVSLPFIVIILVIGGLFFTFRFLFINVRFFKHAIDCVRGKFD
ncbi:MAG: hypothetical protein HRU15_15805, partial [Planctomycetes bacterium]|nr:hypothetical protein [Planctomycetota bacterium]